MKKVVISALLFSLAFPVFAAEDSAKTEEYKELCKSYAKEDGIAADEMQEYLAGCIKDLEETAAAAKD